MTLLCVGDVRSGSARGVASELSSPFFTGTPLFFPGLVGLQPVSAWYFFPMSSSKSRSTRFPLRWYLLSSCSWLISIASKLQTSTQMPHRMHLPRFISNISMILRRLLSSDSNLGLSVICALMHWVGHARTQTMQPVQYGSGTSPSHSSAGNPMYLLATWCRLPGSGY